MIPPIARRIPFETTLHDERRVDDYRWMHDRDDPAVADYLEAENGYADAMLASTQDLRESLYQEMVGRIRETDASVPVRRDEFEYYTRTEKGLQYEIYCRRRGEGRGEEILIDENELAQGHAYHALGVREVSPDHRLLAYTVDRTGAEIYELYVIDLATRAITDGPIVGVAADVEWDTTSDALFYLVLDPRMRPFAVNRHVVGRPVVEDRLVHRETDPAFYVGIEVARSRAFLFITMESHTTTEVSMLTLPARTAAEPFVIAPRRGDIEYHVAHSGESLFMMTNDDATNFRVLEAPVDEYGRASSWREVIPHRPTVKVEAIEAFERHLVVVERENGLKSIRVIDLLTRSSTYAAFDEPVYTVWLDGNPEFHARTLRYSYSSLTTPRTVFDHDMETGERVLRKRYDVPGGFRADDYRAERLFATAADGTRVPISVVYRKDLPLDGSAPLVLYGYGAYGVCVEPHFVSNRASLLDRGVVFAIAHPRGGGELGRVWHERGKRLHKRNTFTDFIACAEYLIERGYTARGNIMCYGGSAGGMLIGAVLNMRPDLWGGAIAVVPFVDVLNTMLDPRLPLTVLEYDEWGNPQERIYYEYIRSYSPYDDVRTQEYPALLVLCGFNDPRVQFWEPAKWVAKLRVCKTDVNPLLLRTRMAEGHKGASGRYDYLRDVALEYAFILTHARLSV